MCDYSPCFPVNTAIFIIEQVTGWNNAQKVSKLKHERACVCITDDGKVNTVGHRRVWRLM